MPYFIDPNSASNLPSAIQSSPKYQLWLKQKFPLPSSHGINMNASVNNNNTNSQGFTSSTPSSTALMIISTGDNKNNSTSDASSSSSNLKNFDMKSLQQQNSNVIINNSAIDANEKFKNTQNSSNDNGASSTSARSVTLEDFNTAFYRKKEGLLRLQREKKEKEADQQQQQVKQQQEQLPEMKSLPQRRTDREFDEIEPQPQQQQQNQNSVSSNSAVFALPDHLGRSFLHCPQQISASEIKRDHFTAQKLPQKLSHSYKTTSSNAAASTTNSAPAITTLSWVPPHGHLAMIGDVTGTCSIFEVINTNNTNANNSVRTEKLAVYSGFHRNAVRDISFPAGDARHGASSASGTLQGASSDRFLTCSTDAANPLALWDTERAQIISEYRLSDTWTTYSKFIRDAGCAAVAFAPPGIHSAATRGDSLFASAFGKTIIVWDARSSTRVIDLEAHHGTVTHLKFVQYGRGLFSCGDDKTLRLWDLRSAAAVQEFSHSQMHSISGVIEHPWTGEVLAQSNDDKVRCLMRTGAPAVSNPEMFVGRLLPQAGQYVFGKEEKEFSGHNVAGTSCRLGLSRTDGGTVVSSGDVFGNLFMWQYDGGKQQQNNNNAVDGSGSTKLLRKFKASAKELTVHDWHPIVSGMLLTGGRDGLLKCWK